MIKIDNLSKCYHQGDLEVQALEAVSLQVAEGEFVSIMGSSGSGKSTMMNILGCLDKPTEGTYLLDNIDVSKMSENQLSEIRNKKIGFVFQSFNLLPKLTSIENVELPMIYGGLSSSERHKKAINALEIVGLESRIKHKPNELSGGQRQRVAIARAIANNPGIILADEPTGNLDSKSTIEIIEIFQRLNSLGATIVMVTHEPEVAMYTKRIVTFKDGHKIDDKKVAKPLIANIGGEKN